MVGNHVSEIAQLSKSMCPVKPEGLLSKFEAKKYVYGTLGVLALGLTIGVGYNFVSNRGLEKELSSTKSQIQVLNQGFDKRVSDIAEKVYVSKLPAYDLGAGDGLKFRVDYNSNQVYDFNGKQIGDVNSIYDDVVEVVDAKGVCLNPNGLIIFLAALENHGVLRSSDLSSEIDYFVGKNEVTCDHFLNIN